MTARGGDRGLAEDQISNRVHVGSLVRIREVWGREEYCPGRAHVTRGRISVAPPAGGALLRPSGWSRAS
jgi:transcription elongation GreA/GreB family factor